jgi:G8 domain
VRTQTRFVIILLIVLCLARVSEAHILTPLAPDDQATHKAVISGAWSNPQTWGGALPGTDARVIVPVGLTVTVDGQFGTPMFWVRVDGTLKFATNVNTSLTADSVFVNHGGRLEMGTALAPVQADKTAELIIKARNGNPIDHSWDPLELSRGLIAESPIEIHGAPKTSWTSVTASLDNGTTKLVLDDAPSGWRTGDTVVLTAPVYDQDEVFSIVSVNGATVTLNRPITYARVPPKKDLALHVASADAGSLTLQGHVMLMEGGHEIRYAGFYGLGRTTIAPVTDPLIVNGVRDPSLMPNCGASAENVRGRYSVHFHMAGPESEQSLVKGTVVSVARGAGLKIGYINHSSNVSFRDNVGYQIDGSTFYTEEGDEVGEFVGNLAIHSEGSNNPSDGQPAITCMKKNHPDVFNRRRSDLGHRGHGYWIHGGGVDVIENVAAGHGSSGFEFWSRKLNHNAKDTYNVEFPVALLRDGGAWAAPKTYLDPTAVPGLFRDNVAYVTSSQKHARKAALSVHYHGLHQWKQFPASPKNVIDGFLGWNTINGMVTSYAGWFELRNIEFIGGIFPVSAKGMGMKLSTQGGNNMDLLNVFLNGFKIPLNVGVASTCSNVIADGVLVTCDAILQTGELDPDLEDRTDEEVPDGDDGAPGRDGEETGSRQGPTRP